jgi:hypothetical protein
MFRIEHNLETGEITQIELTAAEIAAIEAEAAQAQLLEETKATEKTALLAKLGITDDEAKLLLS